MSNSKNRQRWYCRPCDKVAFGSAKRAYETVSWAATHTHNTQEVPNRAYECPYGNGWHLTKKREHTYW